MKPNQAAISIPALALLAVVGMATFPATSVSADDTPAEREARRVADEVRRQQEQGQRQIEAQQKTQADALQGQQDAIQHMEATRAGIETNSQQLAQQTADQVQLYSYPNNTSITSITPLAPALSPVAPGVSSYVPRVRTDDPVSGMSFAPLSERLGSYFGARAGVLVVRAGPGAPFGLQDGDVILSIDGRLPADELHAASILRSYRPGEHVKLRVQRDRKAINIEATAPGPHSN